MNPILRAMTSLQALPFAPLLAELGRELGVFRKEERKEYVPLHFLLTSTSLLMMNPKYDADEFDSLIDEEFLSVLVRVRE